MDKMQTPPAGLTHLLDPNTLTGALVLAAAAFAIATIVVVLIRRFTRRLEKRMSDVTVLRFVSLLIQLAVYLLALVLYAHLIPQLRSVGTALLAGAGVLSVVGGLAAQDTLGNLIAGFSLVMSGAIREGETIKLYTPVGLITARVHLISLGFTLLVDADGNEIVVPNSVIMTSAIARISQENATGAK
ncbi:mechanosensitive ion channel domain-containing protein [Thermomonas sp. HDW16]|uniref:mechanosensitive ion channel domain-containing protein n=1 Tax=Thermomonas sp. HDW16 TaxID=2714945 RepID=UPI00140C5694|nr:mechanosensitive ion channel domain-containing protein [Thermomonas sp. HDW16]QIL21196.1 mechanosensitive ion channel [Thermomonas sp. HDW16]